MQPTASQLSQTSQLNFLQIILLLVLTVQDKTKSNTPWSQDEGYFPSLKTFRKKNSKIIPVQHYSADFPWLIHATYSRTALVPDCASHFTIKF